MTDLTPGSRWLLPVTIDEIDTHYVWVLTDVKDNSATVIQHSDLDTLIPADRITELEAEVGRWQGLYDDARHDLLDAELEVERLREEMLRERD